MGTHRLKDFRGEAPGPVLILGANGFIGWFLYRYLRRSRSDVFGLAKSPNWRTEADPNLFFEGPDVSFTTLLERIRPAVVFDLAAYGAYPDQRDPEKILDRNVLRVYRNLETIGSMENPPLYLLAGSSSEYGFDCDRPDESKASPNSLYAVSKNAGSQLIRHFGKDRKVPCLSLRLFSVYGPYESPDRLIPRLCLLGAEGKWPPLADPETARDFIHVEDVATAFLTAALRLARNPGLAGEVFNIGTSRQTALKEAVQVARQVFPHLPRPDFNTGSARAWDQKTWVARIDKAREQLGWEPRIAFEEGFRETADWWSRSGRPLLEKGSPSPTRPLLSIIVAVFRDEPSLAPLYEGVKRAAEEHGFEFELLFVNDRSPDRSEDRLLELSRLDSRVRGLCHAGNWGSQQAFWTGLSHARGDACVLMDGDLQDPPEMLGPLFQAWKEGFRVVVAKRTSRSMHPVLSGLHRLFYRLAARHSGAPLATDAGDFSLMDRQVVRVILSHKPAEIWLRGLRALAGFETAVVEYHRPARPFGRSTNSFTGLFGWAYRGLFLFSGEPLRRLARLFAAIGIAAIPTSFLITSTWTETLILNLLALGLVLAGLAADLLVSVYRQSLARPAGHLEAIIARGEKTRWPPT